MIICPNCDRQNENHYKFCLGCGTELSMADAVPEPVVDVAPTVLPSPVPVAAAVKPSPVFVEPVAVAPVTPAPREVPLPTPPPAAVVPVEVDALEATVALSAPIAAIAEASRSDDPAPVAAVIPVAVVPVAVIPVAVIPVAVEPAEEPASAPLIPAPDDAFEVGSASVSSTSEALSASEEPASFNGTANLPFDLSSDHVPSDASVAQIAVGSAGDPLSEPTKAYVSMSGAEGARICGSCGATVPQGFKFCGVCGGRYEPQVIAAPVVATPVSVSPAQLVLVHPDGSEGEIFPLYDGENVVGRQHAEALFSNDPFLSPKHVTFYFVKGQLFVRDEGSLNGVFLRIKAEVELFHCDVFRVGQQLLKFEEMGQARPSLPGAGDGTTVMGSPIRGAWGRLSSCTAINTLAAIWTLRQPEERIGRESGDIVFPEDGFISGSHCRTLTRAGRYFLADDGSTNGTYLRIKGEGILAQGDLILLGQQLFRIDLLQT